MTGWPTKRSVDLPQYHGHRRRPVLAIVAPLVMRGQRATVVAEHAATTSAIPLPGPDAVVTGQGLAFCVPPAVEKICLKLSCGRVVADDLEAANSGGSDAAV